MHCGDGMATMFCIFLRQGWCVAAVALIYQPKKYSKVCKCHFGMQISFGTIRMKPPFHLQAVADAKWDRGDDVDFFRQHIFARHKVDDLVKKVRAELGDRCHFANHQCPYYLAKFWNAPFLPRNVLICSITMIYLDFYGHQLMDGHFLHEVHECVTYRWMDALMDR